MEDAVWDESILNLVEFDGVSISFFIFFPSFIFALRDIAFRLRRSYTFVGGGRRKRYDGSYNTRTLRRAL